ncbi:hypothetical protein [Microbacterium sp. SSM24]|uniref:hypothetical protein n=1 Tax=Microbacterium sp. SSM24 TaxID=2991714 RepID=UPI0022278CA3|nr:hypothetical protein [Microbacterium sp. SSM24]MCW3492034.1 hypothetical protein [Microbacterium sp. SSM24]
MDFWATFWATMWGALAGAAVGAIGTWLFALDLRRRDRLTRDAERTEDRRFRESERAEDKREREFERREAHLDREREREDRSSRELRRGWGMVATALIARIHIRDGPDSLDEITRWFVSFNEKLANVRVYALGRDLELLRFVQDWTIDLNVGFDDSDEAVGIVLDVADLISAYAEGAASTDSTLSKLDRLLTIQ